MTMRPVFVRFDGDATVHLFNPWAGTLRAVSCADEKAALTKMYALAGVEVDQAEHELGTRDAPWGARANDALSRGAHFAGFERFQKHPSTRAIVREEVAKVAVDGDALAEAVCDRLAEVIG